MQIIIDMDGTICTEEKTYSRSMAKPLDNAVESVNNLYDEGHTIIIYSARTWMEYEMTVDWLSRYGFKYHQLMLGKPIGDVWIDDRAITCNGWDNVNKILDEKRKKK
ncbi:HAD hydrolase family protein [Janthinobacterium sp. GW460P]|nr:HAD hydrolase family protein [Janthinobacterium sp. GW460P]MCC7707354.1 HAD hydrolase family protein [Janthinobacterium sp. GW460W]